MSHRGRTLLAPALLLVGLLWAVQGHPARAQGGVGGIRGFETPGGDLSNLEVATPGEIDPESLQTSEPPPDRDFVFGVPIAVTEMHPEVDALLVACTVVTSGDADSQTGQALVPLQGGAFTGSVTIAFDASSESIRQGAERWGCRLVAHNARTGAWGTLTPFRYFQVEDHHREKIQYSGDWYLVDGTPFREGRFSAQ